MGRIGGALGRPARLCAFVAALALVAAAWALPSWAATPTSAQTDALFASLLRDPSDPELNKAFAASAEADGAIRHAMAAYERALRANPDDQEARAAFNRLAAGIRPSRTIVRVTGGAGFETNTRRTPDAQRNENDATIDLALDLFDDRLLAGQRWRTIAQATARIHTNETDLTQVGAGVWTGPLFEVGDATELHIAGGGGGAVFDGTLLYAEASTLISLETSAYGAPQLLRLYAAHRSVFADGPSYSDGFVGQIDARLAQESVALEGDGLFFSPRVRVSAPYDDAKTAVGRFDGQSEPVFIGAFVEYGARLAYYAPISPGRLVIGAGFGVYGRSFAQNDRFEDGSRQDVSFEPTAHLIYSGLFGRSADFLLDYSGRFNRSTDGGEAFETHRVATRLRWRF